LLNQIEESLERDPNVLLIGPPGTGKTVALEDLREKFLEGAGVVYFDPDLWDNNWLELDSDARKAISVVFHPSYGYEDFVAGLIPSMTADGFSLAARPGPLVSLAHWANGSVNRRALLIIDEFNRGATAAIFGDTIALLDLDKRADVSSEFPGAAILRPYPREAMSVEDSYRNEQGSVEVARDLTLPRSLWVVAALNSSDRSVTPLDAALRRRFAILSVRPDYVVLAGHLGIQAIGENEPFTPTSDDVVDWSLKDAKAFVVHLLMNLNARIEFLLSSDLLMGHALLWPVGGDTVSEVARSLGRAFDQRIAAALRLTFIDQDEALAAILKAGTPDQPSPGTNANSIARWSIPPLDMQAVASARLVIVPQTAREPLDILRSLRTLL
jgi:5-methylcytosine-specific restriction protein B